jgi:hypothetical protein
VSVVCTESVELEMISMLFCRNFLDASLSILIQVSFLIVLVLVL